MTQSFHFIPKGTKTFYKISRCIVVTVFIHLYSKNEMMRTSYLPIMGLSVGFCFVIVSFFEFWLSVLHLQVKNI